MSRRPGPTTQSVSPAPPPPAFTVSAVWWWLLVFAVTLLAYAPALSAGFIWDDSGHVTRADLRPLAGLARIWFEPGATQQYYPLLHSAFWLEHRLWGDAPLGYHLLNILLHATSAGLFATLLRRLAVPGAWFAALLFALHPVAVESVAWISEQKNTLSAALYLAAALAFLQWHGRPARASVPRLNPGATPLPPPGAPAPAGRHGRPRPQVWYPLATLLFVCALLTKTVTATLPAALLVIFWWQRGRLEFRRDVRPLLPWFVLAAVSGLFTAWFERKLIGAEGAAFALDALERSLLAGRVVWFYLGKLLWPADLIFIYPRWEVDAGRLWPWLFPAAALGLLGVAIVWRRRTRAPLAVLLLFGGTLFPVLGFFNVYPFLFSFVADHFQYLACLPVLAFAAAGFTSLAARWPRGTGLAAATATLLLLGLLSARQAATYRDVFTLWENTLARNPACWMAHNNLAMALAESGRVAEAVPHLEQALALHPHYAPALSNLGDDLTRLGRPAEAVSHLEEALRLQPDYPEAHNNLGIALVALGRTEEAVRHYEAALRLRPAYADAARNLGLALATSGRNAEAIPHFEHAVRLDPGSAEAELSLAIALMLSDRFPAAGPHFERAVQLDPTSADARLTYGRALALHGRLEEAVRRLNEALEINPSLADAHVNLVAALHRLGRDDEALIHAREADRLRRAGP